MRQIKSQEEIDKKRKRNQIIIGVLLIITMLSSTLGFAFFSRSDNQDTSQKIKYNDFEFNKNSNGMWEVTIGEQTFTTTYNPQETEDLNVSFTLTPTEFNNKPLYFVSDNPSAQNEITYNIGRYALRTQNVCLQGTACEENLIVKNCSNNIFVLKSSNQTKAYKQDNCVFIEGYYDEQQRMTDRVIFKFLGIQ
ncbi:MAG: hypothetical protein WC781_04225 [Candidatus Pacearchaeota archaeon]|jgi:hypothetical protein